MLCALAAAETAESAVDCALAAAEDAESAVDCAALDLETAESATLRTPTISERMAVSLSVTHWWMAVVMFFARLFIFLFV